MVDHLFATCARRIRLQKRAFGGDGGQAFVPESDRQVGEPFVEGLGPLDLGPRSLVELELGLLVEGGRPRLGVAAPRAYGGAVRRNRFKRLVREAFRSLRADLGAVDVFVAPRRGNLESPASPSAALET